MKARLSNHNVRAAMPGSIIVNVGWGADGVVCGAVPTVSGIVTLSLMKMIAKCELAYLQALQGGFAAGFGQCTFHVSGTTRNGFVVGLFDPASGSTLTATAAISVEGLFAVVTLTALPLLSGRKTPAGWGAPLGGTSQSSKLLF